MNLIMKDKKKQEKNRRLTVSTTRLCIAALFTALICMATLLIQIPIPLGYAHLGDSVILIAAYFFGPVIGAPAAGIGSALADLLTGFPVWALPTLLIKMLMPLIACGFFYQKGSRKKLFSVRVAAGAVVTLLFMAAGYVLFGGILYGSAAAGLASAPGLLLKAAVNLAVFFLMGGGLAKVFRKQRI